LAPVHIVVISPSAALMQFSDKSLYPNFLRLVPSDAVQGRAVVEVVEHFQWKKVAILTSSDLSGIQGVLEFFDSKYKLEVVIQQFFFAY